MIRAETFRTQGAERISKAQGPWACTQSQNPRPPQVTSLKSESQSLQVMSSAQASRGRDKDDTLNTGSISQNCIWVRPGEGVIRHVFERVLSVLDCEGSRTWQRRVNGTKLCYTVTRPRRGWSVWTSANIEAMGEHMP